MFIQTETTPNPSTLKFIPGETVMASGTVNFTSKAEAVTSPLANALFAITDVKAVFLGNDFITVTKSDDKGWDVLKTEVLTTIMEHFISGQPIIGEGAAVKKADTSNDDDDEIVKQIKELIDTRVRPSVAQDGGDIIFRGFANGVVLLEMHGSCSGCPSSTVTLKNGIETMLKHYIPEVEAVEAVD